MTLKPKKDIDGKWGFVDDKGVFQISPLFDHVEPFIGDYAKASAYGKSFYVNKQGKWYKDIPEDPDAPEDRIMMDPPRRRSPLDILMDGLDKASDALHKGLKDCE